MVNITNCKIHQKESSLSQEEKMKINLVQQLQKIMKNCNEKSIKTRYRYYEANERFCGFLASEFRLQKFVNIKPRHFYEYVSFMKNEGYTPSMIRTELAAIRFFCEKSGNKYNMPTNNQLDLDKKNTGAVDRAWLDVEIKNAIIVANSMGRKDVATFIQMASVLGMRIEEACKCEVKHLVDALLNGELYIKGKNGQVRYLKLFSPQLELIKTLLHNAQIQGKSGADKVLVDSVKGAVEKEKKSIQNWLANNRYKYQSNSREVINNLEVEKSKAKALGIKLKTDKLTAHGLRYYFAQQRYHEFLKRRFSPKYSQLAVSESLGHHRKEITSLYLSGKVKEETENDND